MDIRLGETSQREHLGHTSAKKAREYLFSCTPERSTFFVTQTLHICAAHSDGPFDDSTNSIIVGEIGRGGWFIVVFTIRTREDISCELHIVLHRNGRVVHLKLAAS